MNTTPSPLETLMALLDEVSSEGSVHMIVGNLCRTASGDDASLTLYIRDMQDAPLVTAKLDFHEVFEFAIDQDVFENVDAADPAHPVLWPYVERHAELYFSSAPSDPTRLFVDLHETHDHLVQNWYPLSRFTNDLLPLSKLFMAAHGRLAAGPMPLIRAYERVLREAGVQCSVLDSRAPRISAVRLEGGISREPVALLMGTSYVVARQLRGVETLRSTGPVAPGDTRAQSR